MYSLAVQADGKILVGGFFTTLGGQPRNRIGRLNSDGTLDTAFNPGAEAHVYSLAVQADGKIWWAAISPRWPGRPANSIGRLNNTEPATQSLTFDGSTLTWLRGGTSPEVWRTTFDASTNGTDWFSLGGGTRIPDGWQWTNLSDLRHHRPRPRLCHGRNAQRLQLVCGNQPGHQLAVHRHPAGQPDQQHRHRSHVQRCGGGTPALSYQWRKDGTNLLGATSATLALTSVRESDQGLYSVVVSNAFGYALSSNALLRVNQPPIADASATRPS